MDFRNLSDTLNTSSHLDAETSSANHSVTLNLFQGLFKFRVENEIWIYLHPIKP